MFGQSGLNIRTVLGRFELKFQECSRTSRTEFSEMFRVFLDPTESPLSQKLAKQIVFMGHLMCRDILINFTSYYRCPYRKGLARKVLLESNFVRYSHCESRCAFYG